MAELEPELKIRMTTEQLTVDMPRLQRDGGAMPVLGLGTYELTGPSCRKTVASALAMGYRHVDTARMYQNEKEVGQGIAESGLKRAEIFLTSKLEMGELDAKGVEDSCEKSLRALGTDYLDLLLIHWPEEDAPLAETIGAMEDLKRKGRIRHLGVSNFTVDWMKRAVAAAEQPIFCNQVEYHPYLSQRPLLDFCRELGIAIVAYSPLARGLVARDERLAGIGRKHGKSPAQVSLRWLIHQDGVIAIPKGGRNEHLRENLGIFDFELDAEDLAFIDTFEDDHRQIDPDWAPRWDT